MDLSAWHHSLFLCHITGKLRDGLGMLDLVYAVQTCSMWANEGVQQKMESLG